MNDGGSKYVHSTSFTGQTRWQSLAETAMGAMIQAWGIDHVEKRAEHIARASYVIADAMLAEEKRRLDDVEPVAKKPTVGERSDSCERCHVDCNVCNVRVCFFQVGYYTRRYYLCDGCQLNIKHAIKEWMLSHRPKSSDGGIPVE